MPWTRNPSSSCKQELVYLNSRDRVPALGYLSKELDAKIYKQVGGVLIDQKKKEVKSTLSNRVALIKNQIEHTNELLKKNEQEQKALAEKIQKAKERYY